MKKALILAFVLTGCATPSAVMVSQTLEKIDTDAALAYAAVATSVNAAEEARPQIKVAGEAVKVKAWRIFAAEHKAYTLGQTYDISGLLALVQQAKGL